MTHHGVSCWGRASIVTWIPCLAEAAHPLSHGVPTGLQCDGTVAAPLSLHISASAHLPASATQCSGGGCCTPQLLKAPPVTICQQQRFPEGVLQGLCQLPLGLIMHQLQQ